MIKGLVGLKLNNFDGPTYFTILYTTKTDFIYSVTNFFL